MVHSASTGWPANQPRIWLIGPIAVVEQQPPGGAGDDRRDDRRQHQQRDEDLPPGHAFEEQLRHQQAEDQFDGQAR